MNKFEIINLIISGIAVLVAAWSLWFSIKTSRDSKKISKKLQLSQLLSEKEIPCSIPVDVSFDKHFSVLKINKQVDNWELDWILMDFEWDVYDSYEEAIKKRDQIGKHNNFYTKQWILDYLLINYECEVQEDSIV